MISPAVPRFISSGPAIAARSRLRRHPRVQRAVVRVLSLHRNAEAYEHSFRSAMLACIRPGDCVWDVGANVGFYSELFAMAVGRAGKVISFEPSPACIRVLEERLRERAMGVSWEVVPVALSDDDGEAWLSVASGDTAPDNHLASEHEPAVVRVRTERGDAVVAAGHAAPEVIKIDVEGFEGEVLDGMGLVLDRPSLRAVCVEVHFGALNARGKPSEPARIVRLLQDHAFAVKWIDRSHFVAQR
jgi:FkbM family methyltransferase